MKNTVTVIYQVNCHIPGDVQHASLWVAKGDATADPEGPYPEENPDAFRLVGPAQADDVRQLVTQIVGLLRFLEFDVREETVTDD